MIEVSVLLTGCMYVCIIIIIYKYLIFFKLCEIILNFTFEAL